MNETQAASSPAEVDVFEGQQPTLAEWNAYRQDGTLPERLKPAEKAESATADEPEKTESEGEPESAGDPETPKAQEPKKPRTAAQRIAKLEADIEKEWEKDEPDTVRIAQFTATIEKIKGGKERKTEPAPVAQPKTQVTAETEQYAFPKPKIDDKHADGTAKYADYEQFVEALGRWAAKEERVALERDFAKREQERTMQSRIDAARERYENADAVIGPTIQAINQSQIPPAVRAVLEESTDLLDILYVLGSDPDDGAEGFISLARTNPRAAIAKVFEYERAIREELDRPESTARGEDGKFVAKDKAPEKRKTQAPPPPEPVGGGSKKGFDVNDESMPTEQWFRMRNAQVEAQRR